MDTSPRRAARRWTINVLFVYTAGRCRSPILNRAERIGPSGRHQRLADWIKAAGAEREPYDALGTNPGDDVPDPYGQRPRVWNRVINDLDDMVSAIAAILPLGEARQRFRRAAT